MTTDENTTSPETFEVPTYLAHGLRWILDSMQERREALGPNPTDEEFEPLVRELMARLREWFALIGMPLPAPEASEEDGQPTPAES